jgi:hypothetical protein
MPMSDEQHLQAKTLKQNNNDIHNNKLSLDVFNGALMLLLYFEELLE